MEFLLGAFLILLIVGMAIFFGALRNVEDNKDELRKLKEEVRQLRQEQEKLKRKEEE